MPTADQLLFLLSLLAHVLNIQGWFEIVFIVKVFLVIAIDCRHIKRSPVNGSTSF